MQSILFHGSLNPGITTFKPFSHFGTKLAALQAIVKKINDIKDANIKISPTLYEIEFNESKLNLLHAEDWGGPSIIPTTVGIRDALIDLHSENHTDAIEIENIRKDLIKMKIDKDNNYPNYGEKKVEDFLNSLNYHGLKYINVVEGIEGSESICFTNSNHYKIKNIFTPTSNEISEAKKLLRQSIIQKT